MFWEFLNVHFKHLHAWVSVWFNMAQRTGEPRVLRSRSSRVIPPSSSQTEDTSAPATDARSDKQDFLDSILSSMQEQQRLMTFLVERQQQLTAQTHPAVPSPSAQLAQLSPLARRVELPILADPQTLDLSAFVNWKPSWKTDDGVDAETSLSFFLSLSLHVYLSSPHFFLVLTIGSINIFWKMRVSSKELFSTLKNWKSRWQDYLRLTRIETELTDAPLQQAFLRSALDPAWVSVWNAGLLGKQHGHLFPDIVQRPGDYLRKKHNALVSRKEFYARSQQECETANQFFSVLTCLENSCAFEDDHICTRCNRQCSYRSQFRDIRLRDRLICGLRDSHLVRRILEQHYDNNLSLERVLQMCAAHESAANTQCDLHGSPAMAMAVKSSYRKAQTGHPTPRTTPAEKRSSCLCPFCGEDFHTRDQCPASRKRCLKCGKIGHFRSVCKRQLEPKTLAELDSVLAEPVEEPDSVGTSSSGAVGHLYVHRLSTKDRMVDVAVTLEGSVRALIKWLPDTGADVDAIPLAVFERLGSGFRNRLQENRLTVKVANGVPMGHVGTFTATLQRFKFSHATFIHVLRDLQTPLLSIHSCKALGLLQDDWPNSDIDRLSLGANTPGIVEKPDGTTTHQDLNSLTEIERIKETLLEEFAQVFCDRPFKTMDGPPMHIDIVENAIPCRHYCARNIPFQWRESVEAQLKYMEEQGIIEKVPTGESFTWCHPLAVVPKKGSTEPRITVDLSGLNKYVKRPAYPTRSPREAVAAISPGSRYFTTLDSRHGYWQIPLDDDSAKLTTFLTPWGAFRFKRNVMGLISAGDEHNRRSDDALSGIRNMQKVGEDIILYDKDLSSHVERVRKVLQCCADHGITLHRKKFVFAVPETSYFGFRVFESGYAPDDHLVRAFKDFPVPTNKTDVRSFCGLAQQFEEFDPQLSALLSPLRSLLSSKSVFQWEAVHQEAFVKARQILSSPRILTSYDRLRPHSIRNWCSTITRAWNGSLAATGRRTMEIAAVRLSPHHWDGIPLFSHWNWAFGSDMGSPES